MSILNKVLPGKGSNELHYLALLITYHSVEASIWKITENRLDILHTSIVPISPNSDIVEIAADAIDQVCEKVDIDAKAIILGLPDSWISQNQILPQYFDRLKAMAQSLDITPFAFVAQNHAICNRLKLQYGNLLSGFLLSIDNENVTLSSIIGGHLTTTRFTRSEGGDVSTSIQKLFVHFTNLGAPETMVFVTGSPIPAGVESFMPSLSFFGGKPVKTVLLDPKYAICAISYAGAVDRGNSKGIHVEDMVLEAGKHAMPTMTGPVMPVLSHNGQPEELSEPAQPNVPEAVSEVPPVPVAATNLPAGFVLNDDIAKHDNLEPAVLPSQEQHEAAPEHHEPPLEHQKEPPLAKATPEQVLPTLVSHPLQSPSLGPGGFVGQAAPPVQINQHIEPQHHDQPMYAVPEIAHRRHIPLGNAMSLLAMGNGLLSNAVKMPFNLVKMTGGKSLRLLIIIAVPVILVIALIAGATSLAKAQVEITFTPKVLEDTKTVTVSRSSLSNPGNLVIPGTLVSTDVTSQQTGTATGKKKIGEKAKGTVTLYNKTALAKTFAAGTTLTQGSLSFVLDSVTTVPARTATESANRDILIKPGKATANASASDIGEDHNIAANTDLLIKGQAKDSFDATVATAFTGGSSKEVRVISDSDIKQAETVLLKTLQEQAKQDLSTKVTGGQRLITESVTVSTTQKSSSKKAGEEGNEFTISVAAKAQGLSISKETMDALLAELIGDQLTQDYSLMASQSTQTPTYKRTEKNGDVVVNWHYLAKLAPKFNNDEIANRIKGKSFGETQRIINGLPNVSNVVIRITPPFLKVLGRLPMQPSHIAITTNAQ